jgi:hypothetical protein
MSAATSQVRETPGLRGHFTPRPHMPAIITTADYNTPKHSHQHGHVSARTDPRSNRYVHLPDGVQLSDGRYDSLVGASERPFGDHR